MNRDLTNYFHGCFKDSATTITTASRNATPLPWHKIEVEIGNIFLDVLLPFIHRPLLPSNRGNYRLSNISGANIRLGAVNFRGFYQRNGRQTKLQPSNHFPVKVSDNKYHDFIHKVYLQLTGKALSINQFFLINTKLDALAIQFDSENNGLHSKVTMTEDRKRGKIILSKEFVKNMIPSEVTNIWDDIIKRIFEAHSESRLNNLENEGNFNELVLSSKEKCEAIFNRSCIEYFSNSRNRLDLLRQWLNVPDKNEYHSLSEITMLFEEWLRSIFWLRFYCRPKYAGAFFYTVRLPNILGNPKLFPDSSLSLVSSRMLDATVLKTFEQLANLSRINGFEEFQAVVKKEFKEFKNIRVGPKHAEAPNFLLGKALEIINKEFPLDLQKLEFLMKMTRKLVGQKHEGHSLRFCFIFGFSREMIDAESRGNIDEHTIGLRNRWEIFFELIKNKCVKGNDEQNKKIVAEAMAKWIKNNDLQLQPYDVAVYFEESDEHYWPIPTSIVRLKDTISGKALPVSTNTQLHTSLRTLTKNRRGTAAVVTGKGGLFLFYGGKCILLPCNPREEYEDSLRPKLYNNLPLEDEIVEFFKKELLATFPDLSVDKIDTTANVLNKLLESIVTLGHGAMLVVRKEKENIGEKNITPLNPVWCLRSSISSEVDNEYAIYALMAALDGAAELIISDGKDDSMLKFGCRKFVQTIIPIWREDGASYTGDAALCDKVAKNIDILKLLGKGTRHHSAFALSCALKNKALVITVSADGPVTIWRNGQMLEPTLGVDLRYAP